MSDLMDCLEPYAHTTSVRPKTDVTVFDGAVLVNMLRPGGCNTFGDYASKVFVPYVQKEHSHVKCVDIGHCCFGSGNCSEVRQKRNLDSIQHW